MPCDAGREIIMVVQSGFVKIQNVQLPFGGHLIPEFLFIGKKAWRPCSLPATIVNRLDSKRILASIVFESEMNRPCWIYIDTVEHRCVRNYADGSALYECRIEGVENLGRKCSFEHEEFLLRLYHHTNSERLPQIIDSGRLRASRWNYEGTMEHKSRHFIYFTDVASLNTPDDFRRVAMSDGGVKICLEYDQPAYGLEILDVPERSKQTMDARLELLVEPDLIESQPMLYHDQSARNEGRSLYWELLHQNIFRIPVHPGGSITVTEQGKIVRAEDVVGLEVPDTILAGCAFIKDQIRVVFDENDYFGCKIVRASGEHRDPLERFLSNS